MSITIMPRSPYPLWEYTFKCKLLFGDVWDVRRGGRGVRVGLSAQQQVESRGGMGVWASPCQGMI